MIYLDNAATSYRKPQPVIDAVCAALSGMGNAGRGAHQAALDASFLAFETRRMLSELFGGYGPENVAFTSNSTEALNTAIAGTLCPADHAVTTMLEHNSVSSAPALPSGRSGDGAEHHPCRRKGMHSL